ncbi:MAG: thioredoxin [Thermodesulfobacteriota bacterium]|nr:thioredoxin [Thermodesulfobacteriota bacterium]
MNRTTIITCPGCGTRNRVALDRMQQGPRCGKCKALLPAYPDSPVTVTDNNFDRAVLGETLPVLVDCWAPWCGPCKMIGPILDELARTYQGRLKIVKLNVDENPRTAGMYHISSIPTLLFVKNGKVVDTQVGAPPRNKLEQQIESFL